MLVAEGEFDEDVFEGSLVAVEGADGPGFFLGEFCDARAGFGIGLDEEGGLGPAGRGVFEGDFFDVREVVESGFEFGGGGIDFERDVAGSTKVGDEIGGGVVGFDAALVDDDDFLADHFDFGENVGGEKDGALFCEGFDEVAD